ncbi:MAG TPA: STAS domain-containing protein [Planctomycetota bacterium]|nr:STAS domain-containing protein [Planctomycetota bacterium]
MITSYVNPQRSLLYLSLVGPLNEYSANDLVNEYYERHGEDLRQCILDLSGAEGADGSGLNVLHRIALLTQVDGIEFSVIAGGSTCEAAIAEAARRFWVALVDGKDVPFFKRAG